MRSRQRGQRLRGIASTSFPYGGYAPADDPPNALLVFYDEPADRRCVRPAARRPAPIFAAIMEGECSRTSAVDPQEYGIWEDEKSSPPPRRNRNVIVHMTMAEKRKAIWESRGFKRHGLAATPKTTRSSQVQVPSPGASIPKEGWLVAKILYTEEPDSRNSMEEVPRFIG